MLKFFLKLPFNFILHIAQYIFIVIIPAQIPFSLKVDCFQSVSFNQLFKFLNESLHIWIFIVVLLFHLICELIWWKIIKNYFILIHKKPWNKFLFILSKIFNQFLNFFLNFGFFNIVMWKFKFSYSDLIFKCFDCFS